MFFSNFKHAVYTLNNNLCDPNWMAQFHTSALRYLRKKSSRNDLPFLKAPATDTTTTFFSWILGSRRTFSSFSSSSSKTCSVFSSSSLVVALMICSGSPLSRNPLADTVGGRNKRSVKLHTNDEGKYDMTQFTVFIMYMSFAIGPIFQC